MTETVLSHAPLTGPDLARACGVTTLPVSALLTFPTGSGKTHLALEAAQGTLTSGGTVIVLLPLKALVEELLVSWSAALPGTVVQGYTSDTRSAKPYRDAQVMLMTAERLDLLLRNWRRHHAWLARVRVLVADEVHLIADPSRGAALDSAVTRLRFVNPLLRVLALTATCGNPEDLARWLGGVHIGGGERPVPLDWKAMTVRDAREKPGLLPELLSGGESTLVFVHSRKRCEELAEKFADFGAEAYHAGLISTDRLAVAGRYRSGQTRVLFTTPALELGLNFACRHAVLYDLTLPDAGAFKQIGVNAAWQRAGRAGRVRGEGPARATVIGSERERPERYLTPDFEPLFSALARQEALMSCVLGILDGGLARTRAQLERLLNGTLAARQGRLDTAAALADLLHQGGLSEAEGQLEVTPLGRIASQSLLPLLSVKAAQFLPEDPTVMDVLLRACMRAQGLPAVRADAAGITLLALEDAPSRTLDQEGDWHLSPQVQQGAVLALMACTEGDDEAARAFSLYRPQVTALREELLRVLEAWNRWRPEVEKLPLVRTMLAAQLPLNHATLALLPGVGRAGAKKLAHAGIEDAEALAQLQGTDTLPGFTPGSSRRLILAAEQLVKRLSSDPTREPTPGTRGGLIPRWSAHIDPLRLRRSLSLHVRETGGTFLVSGGEAEHHVTSALACDCPDQTPTRHCKHVLAVLRHQRDPAVLHTLEWSG